MLYLNRSEKVSKDPQLTLKFALILSCCLFVSVTRAEVPASCMTCSVPFWESPPKDSWLRFEQVTVRIDDAWESTERQYFREGIEQWNSADNCSGVTFSNFSSIHFSNYNDAPPDFTLWWQKRSPVGVTYFFTSPLNLQRLRAVIVPIPANFQNTISNSFFVYLGTHEVGHTFDLGDCLANNLCQAVAGTCSIMGGQSQNPNFNITGPKVADNNSVDVVYCPFVGTPEDCEAQGKHWNYISEQCTDEEASCAETCWESGLDVDRCKYESGCPEGFSYGELRGSTCCDPIEPPPCPVAIDVDGKGFHLTDAADGVEFDIDGNGYIDRVSWIAANSTNAWLVLDRNGNGKIDNGTELFGNVTLQTTPPRRQERNGFLALSEYDKLSNGGNADGLISFHDSIFSSLRLWQDSNHNGVSEAVELKTLTALAVKEIDCRYKESKRRDEFGNQFRYRAKIGDQKNVPLGRWAWDVFLLKQ